MTAINWEKLKRTMLFIDASNIYYSQRTLGWQIDYQKVINFFSTKANLKAAHFYSGTVTHLAPQQKFLQKMRQFGYIVKTKEVKWIKTNQKKIIGKGSLDIELALDLTHKTRQYDTALLFSGDSDFAPAVAFIQSKQKQVIAFSSRGHISRELARQANRYIPFESLKQFIQRKNHPALKRGKYSKPILLPARKGVKPKKSHV